MRPLGRPVRWPFRLTTMATIKVVLLCTIVCCVSGCSRTIFPWSCENEEVEFSGGNITDDTRLDVSKSPYRIDTSIIIESNVTLEIDPGVQLLFRPGTGMLVKGTLVANGTESQRIIFTASEPTSLSSQTPYSWHGIMWMDGAGSMTQRLDDIPTTRSLSFLGNVDVNAAGAMFVEDTNSSLRFSGTIPALVAISVAPFLDKVNITENYGPGVDWREVATVVEIHDSEISNNKGNGIVFSSNGFGRLIMEGCVVNGNFGNGISSNFRRPSASPSSIHHNDSCPVSMSIDRNTVVDFRTLLQHTVSECVLVLQSPPGSTMTAFFTLSYYYDQITFWNGNSTEDTDILSVRAHGNTYGNLISTSTNHITIKAVMNEQYLSYSRTILITVQQGMDYDLFLRNSSIVDNKRDGLTIATMNRRLLISDSSFISNAGNGIRIGKNFGSIDFANVVVENNGNSGFLSDRDYGEVMIDQSTFLQNKGHGIYLRIYINRYHTHHISVTNSNVSKSGDYGVYFRYQSCSGMMQIILTNSDIGSNTNYGLRLTGCRSSRHVGSEISSNRFYENTGVVINLEGNFINFFNNTVYNNTGVNILRWTLPKVNDRALSFKNNVFDNNNADAIVINLENIFIDFIDNTMYNNTGVNILRWTLPRVNDRRDRAVSFKNNVFNNNNADAIVINLKNIFIDFIDNTMYDNTGVNILRWTLPRVDNKSCNRNNTFDNNYADAIVRIVLNRYSTSEFKGNLFKNNVGFSILLTESDQDTSSFSYKENVLSVSNNIFMNNIPKPFSYLLTTVIPISTVALATSLVDLTENSFNNPFFPLELFASCERFDLQVNATMNYWGNITEVELEERVYDFSDRYDFCTVNLFPYLTSPSRIEVVAPNIKRSHALFQRGNIIGGVVNGHVTIPITEKDYIVDRDIIIPHGAKLIIEPGVTLHFIHFASIFVKGELIAIGSSDDKITMSSYYANHTSATVRLTDGISPWEGRLEVLIETTWHTVCNRHWTANNARVVCRQLGFIDVEQSSNLKQRGGPRLSPTLDCVGTETLLQQCKPRGDSYACRYYDLDVSIQCVVPRWGGIVFPLDSERSSLKHVTIHDAGYKSNWLNSNYPGVSYIKTEAVLVHLYHHEFENIRIYSASTGFHVYHKDPFYNESNILPSVTIADCAHTLAAI